MSDKPHLNLVFPRGECLRNFVYSGMAGHSRASAKVSLLSVIPSPTVRGILEENVDELDELISLPQDYRVRLTREILSMAHGRRLWSEAAKARWRFRELEANSFGRRLRLWGKRLMCYPLLHQPGMRLLHRLESWTSQTWPKSDHFTAYYRQKRPDLVFNASHVHSTIATPAIHAARQLDIPTATFLFSWDNLTSQGPIYPLYDHYLVWNREIANQLQTIYPSIQSHQITVTGTPQFDFHFDRSQQWTKAEFCQRTGADPSRKLVLYTTGMPNHMPGEEVLVEALADLLKSLPGSPQLMVRVYAKDRTGRFKDLQTRRKDILFPRALWEMNWLTPLPEDGPLWSNMLRYSDIGVNVASTVSLELFMFGKPTINIAFNPPGIDISPKDYASYYSYDHYQPVAQSGGLYLVRSLDELKQALASGLQEPDARREAQNKLLNRFFADSLDGKSGTRVTKALLEIIAQETSKEHKSGRSE